MPFWQQFISYAGILEFQGVSRTGSVPNGGVIMFSKEPLPSVTGVKTDLLKKR
jgi:hypothetical protein